MTGLVAELVVGAEHRLGPEGGLGDHTVYVEEETRETSGEVCEETFRHRSYLPLDVVRQVLVMMFLQKASFSVTSLIKSNFQTYLIPQSPQQILHRLPIILPELAQILNEPLV